MREWEGSKGGEEGGRERETKEGRKGEGNVGGKEGGGGKAKEIKEGGGEKAREVKDGRKGMM